jgi:hypothetical protein
MKLSIPRTGGALVVALILLALILVILPAILVPMPSARALNGMSMHDQIELKDSRFRLRNDVRATLIQAAGGILLAIGAVTAWRQLRIGQGQLELNQRSVEDQARLGKERQATEQFSRAVEQIGSTSLDVRIGGLYTLGRLLNDETIDVDEVSEILAAYLRNHAYWPEEESRKPMDEASLLPYSLLHQRSPDVQVAITVLGRRKRHANFPYTSLLTEVNLRGAVFADGDYQDISFIRANLQYCSFQRANFNGSRLGIADLRKSYFEDAKFLKANFQRCNLTGANEFSQADFNGSETDRETVWPEDFDLKEAGITFLDD